MCLYLHDIIIYLNCGRLCDYFTDHVGHEFIQSSALLCVDSDKTGPLLYFFSHIG
jgi:hypothetical protein